jgi:hemoglobin
LHPEDLTHSRDKLYRFLVGRLGGPPLYVDKYGHPMLRAKHAPFLIGHAERDQWLLCMNQAISECLADQDAAAVLREFLVMVADSMRNKSA